MFQIRQALKSNIRISKRIGFYVLEFVLIFIAVAAGAFVDNFREYLQDKKTEKYLVNSLVEDLKKDVVQHQNYIDVIEGRILGMDSLLMLAFSLDEKNQAQLKMLYRYQLSYTGGIPPKLIRDHTKIQIEDGGLATLTNRKVVNALLEYWALADFMTLQAEMYNQNRWEARKSAYYIFDSKYILRTSGVGKMSFEGDIKLLPNYKEYFPVYYNWISNMRGALIANYLPGVKSEMASVKNLLELIKSEYQLSGTNE